MCRDRILGKHVSHGGLVLWLQVRLGLGANVGQYSGKTELAVRAQRNSQVQTRWIWTPLGLLRGSQAEGRGED